MCQHSLSIAVVGSTMKPALRNVLHLHPNQTCITCCQPNSLSFLGTGLSLGSIGSLSLLIHKNNANCTIARGALVVGLVTYIRSVDRDSTSLHGCWFWLIDAHGV